jgi:hypothetical protein
MSNAYAVLTVCCTGLEDGMGARGTGVLLRVVDMLDPRSVVILHPQWWAVFSHLPTYTLLFPDLTEVNCSQSAPDLLIG